MSMDMIRNRLRTWLGIDKCATYDHMNINLAAKQTKIDALQAELDSFRSALKAKAAESRQRPVYTDYESSQKLALKDFEEKNNGISS